jgi:hypothetical protein
MWRYNMSDTKKVRAPVDAGNFKKRVAGVIKSGKSIRGNIQELMQFAIVDYLTPASNGNTSKMTFLYSAVQGVKSLNHRTLGQFVEDTVNVTLSKTSEGEPVFKKAVKGDAPSFRDGGDIDAPWWEHGRVNEPKAVDLLKVLDAAIKSVSSTINNDAAKRKSLQAGQMCAVQQTLTGLEDQRTATLKLINDHAEDMARAEDAAAEMDAERESTTFVGPIGIAA